MIDAYRHLMLIKHPSRGVMSARTKQLIAYLYANVMSCGEKWATDDELEDMRLRAATAAAEGAAAREKQEQEHADKKTPYIAWCKEHSAQLVAEARKRGMKGNRWTAIAKEWWAVSDRNPANRAQQAACLLYTSDAADDM
eukprot:7388378-Prymnesium_polylepis.1